MKQKFSTALQGLDPATRRAAQDAAASAGVPLEDWLEQAVSQRAAKSGAPGMLDIGLSPRHERTEEPDELDEIAVKLQRLAQERASTERRSIDAVLAASVASERRVRETVEKTATALDSVAAWIERAEGRFGETSRSASESQERTASLVSETIGMVTRRLEDIERKLENGEHASIAEAVTAIERMESRLTQSSAQDQVEQGAQIEVALRGFEDRISALTERLLTLGPRPLGRRGIPAGTELRSAISEIRSRQFELEQGPAPDTGFRERFSDGGAPPADFLRSLREDIARLSGQIESPRPADGEVTGLRSEMTEVQGALQSLARRDDVKALEGSIQALSTEVALARSSGEGSEAIIAPLRTLEAEVRRLSDEVAPESFGQLARDIARLSGQLENSRPSESEIAGLRTEMTEVHGALRSLARRDDVTALEGSIQALSTEVALARSSGEGPEAIIAPLRTLEAEVRRLSDEVAPENFGQITRDIERLAGKLDLVAGAGVDASTVDTLSDQLTEVRGMLGAVAKPDQIEDLARQVEALTRETSELRTRQIDSGDFATVKQAIEDIRSSLASSPRMTKGAIKLDDLRSTVAPLQTEIERLSRHVEGFVARPQAAPGPGIDPAIFDALAERLSRIEENVTRTSTSDDLHESLQQLAAKLERAERPGAGREAVDALERQIESIAGRLDRGFGNDPALSSLERLMNDLMTQVGTWRDGTMEAAELAARNAVAGTLNALPQKLGSANGDIGAIKRDMSDIKAYQGLVEKRTQSSLDGLQVTLDKLLSRLDSGDDQTLPALPSSGSSSRPTVAPKAPTERIELGARPSAPALRATTGSVSVFEPERPVATISASPADEVLLEPGAGRPAGDGASASANNSFESGADIKASFIAAARRAAQAAATEAAAETRDRGAPRIAVPMSVTGGKSVKTAATAPKHAVASTGVVKAFAGKRVRPLLIGLAAAVLALGTFQLYRATQRPTSSDVAVHDSVKALPDPVPGRPVDPGTTQSLASSTPGSLTAEPQGSAGAQSFANALPEPATTSAFVAPEASRTGAPDALAKTSSPPLAEPGQTASIGAPAIAPVAPAPAEISRRPDRPVPVIAAADIPSGIPAGLRQAVAGNDASALYELGLRVSEGRGVAKDPKLAARLFERSAALGLAPAQYRTGSLYEKGIGVPRDIEGARFWYQRAAEFGNTRAMHNLAVLLAEGGVGKADYPAAIEWFRRAADHGVRDSQFNLGVLLARGLGTPQDLPRAYTWFAVAALQGDEDAAKKRDEVGARMASGDVASAKLAAERWRARTAAQNANDVTPPASGWSDVPKRAGREGRG